MKKALPIIAITACGFAQNPCAPEEPNCYTQDPCERCYCLGPAETIANAPVRPVTCDGDVFIQVAGLYWKANQDGMEYAVDTAIFLGSLTSVPDLRDKNNLVSAEYLNPEFKWNFGFKLGIGYAGFCDGWDIGVLWTRFRGSASSHDETEGDDNHTLLTLWSAFQSEIGNLGPYPGVQVTDIRTSWKLYLDLIDLSLGREFWVSRYLAVRPNVGLRYASINQRYCLEHHGGEFSDPLGGALQPHLNDTVDLENDFHGLGIIAGFNTHWYLGCGWGLYGDLATSILYGKFDIDHDEYTRIAESPFTKTRILETEDSFRASRAIVDLALGIEYSTLFCECKYGFTAQLGWEQHLFFHQNQMWRVNRKGANESIFPNLTGENIQEQRRGTLETHGFTLSLQLDF